MTRAEYVFYKYASTGGIERKIGPDGKPMVDAKGNPVYTPGISKYEEEVLGYEPELDSNGNAIEGSYVSPKTNGKQTIKIDQSNPNDIKYTVDMADRSTDVVNGVNLDNQSRVTRQLTDEQLEAINKDRVGVYDIPGTKNNTYLAANSNAKAMQADLDLAFEGQNGTDPDKKRLAFINNFKKKGNPNYSISDTNDIEISNNLASPIGTSYASAINSFDPNKNFVELSSQNKTSDKPLQASGGLFSNWGLLGARGGAYGNTLPYIGTRSVSGGNRKPYMMNPNKDYTGFSEETYKWKSSDPTSQDLGADANLINKNINTNTDRLTIATKQEDDAKENRFQQYHKLLKRNNGNIQKTDKDIEKVKPKVQVQLEPQSSQEIQNQIMSAKQALQKYRNKSNKANANYQYAN